MAREQRIAEASSNPEAVVAQMNFSTALDQLPDRIEITGLAFLTSAWNGIARKTDERSSDGLAIYRPVARKRYAYVLPVSSFTIERHKGYWLFRYGGGDRSVAFRKEYDEDTPLGRYIAINGYGTAVVSRCATSVKSDVFGDAFGSCPSWLPCIKIHKY